jgi:small subunit ribosomal protein S13
MAKKEEEEFNYIVRIQNTELNGSKNIPYALTKIKGISQRTAFAIVDKAGVPRNIKLGNLDEKGIEKLEKTIDNFPESAADWMKNRRRSPGTGIDTHLFSTDVVTTLREDINFERKIRSYRGIRHERGLKVRGQRTKAHPRKGLAVGVSRTRIKQQREIKEKEGKQKEGK